MHIIESESKDSDISSVIEESLRNRRKLQHLTHNQFVWIYNQLKMKKQTVNEIIDKYEISSSTLRRIVRSKGVHAMKYQTDSITTYLEWLNSVWVMKFIETYIKRNKTSFTALDIWRNISKELHITISPHVIRRVLKERFALSYKKGSDRPSSLNIEKQNWLKAIFWLHLIENLNSFRLIVNVDGWILTRSIKQRYSWLEKGKSCKVYSSQYKGSMSLLSAISNDGSSLTAAYSSTIDSTIFLAFIHNLLEFYSKRAIKHNSEVLLIMDNCPYQTSGSTKDKLREWKVNVLYLPPYCPELAPVELMFRSLKSKLRSFRSNESISYLSQKGIDLVTATLAKIRSKEIQSYWGQLYKEVKQCIHFIRDNW